jgi:hypothetical protein
MADWMGARDTATPGRPAPAVLVVGAGAVGLSVAGLLLTTWNGPLTLWDPTLLTPTDVAEDRWYTPNQVGMPRARGAAARLRTSFSNANISVIDRESHAVDAVGAHDLLIVCGGGWRDLLSEALRHRLPTLLATIQGEPGILIAVGGESAPERVTAQLDAVLPPSLEVLPGRRGAQVAAVVGALAAIEAGRLLDDPHTAVVQIIRYDGRDRRVWSEGGMTAATRTLNSW